MVRGKKTVAGNGLPAGWVVRPGFGAREGERLEERE